MKELRTRKVVCRFTESEYNELVAEAMRRQGPGFITSAEVRRRCFYDARQEISFSDQIKQKK